jgi:protein-tyrosine phosphatase
MLNSEIPMPSILFVCTANICRSPMAEGLMRKKVTHEPDASQWQIASAGTWASDGLPASENSRLVMLERGIDLTRHKSQCITDQIMRSYHLILTMEQGHKEALRVEFPDQANQIYLLSEMVGGRFNVEDPFGGTLAEYEQTANELDQLLTHGYENITRLARGFR